MLRLSKTSKLDGIKSWSLEALVTCPGSIKAGGELVDACKGCYATTGNYRFPNVKKPRIENKEDWKRPDFESDFIKALEKETYFRWFDSGDVYAIDLAEKIYNIMKATPHVKHWLPTRMHKFEKFASILEKMANLPNVCVRFSSDSINGSIVESGNAQNSTIIESSEKATNEMFTCQAYQNDGKCNQCRACWNKEVKTIAYPAHGKKMLKIINLKKI